jgi:hypothetical protein
MPDQPRPLPGQPNLRYLKLEARRRLAAGEFSTLHDAQLAIAREHGQPSWTALKQLIESRLNELGHPALTELRWVISRFGAADTPGWAAPADGELREHLTGDLLEREMSNLGLGKVVTGLTRRAAPGREELVIIQDGPLHARARASGWLVEADAEPEPPHRLTGLRMTPVGSQVTDARVSRDCVQVQSFVPIPSNQPGYAARWGASAATDFPAATARRVAGQDGAATGAAFHAVPPGRGLGQADAIPVLRRLPGGSCDVGGDDGMRTGSTRTACTGCAAPSAFRRLRNHARKIIGKPYVGNRT